MQDLEEADPGCEVISNVASWGLQTLLDRVFAGDLAEVMDIRDRLARFDLLEQVLRKLGVRILVQSQDSDSSDTAGDDVRELQEYLLSVVTVFVARHYGRRTAANRKRR